MLKKDFIKTIKTSGTRFSYAPVLAVVAAFTLMVVLSSYFMVNRENNMVLEIPGIDTEKVMELYAGDLEIYLPVLRSYVSVIPDALDIMSRVCAETLPEYIVKVHGVKSTSDGIGAEEARKMAYELEMLAKSGDLSAVLAKNGALLQYVRELLVNIQSWLAKIDAS
jgi:HPt (histidine-containing phosphotransfer) domain-containing protein